MSNPASRVRYKGFRSGEAWEVVVERLGQPLRLLERPRQGEELSSSILADYLGDAQRAADLNEEFAALTIQRFTGDWELTGSDIEDALMEVEVLRARWRRAIVRG